MTGIAFGAHLGARARFMMWGLVVAAMVMIAAPVPVAADLRAGTVIDKCHVAAGQRPARCPRDDRVAMLPADMRQNHIFFASGGYVLDADAQQQLILLAGALSTRGFDQTCLRLVGHADSSGDAATNEAIAMARAEAVRDFLMVHMPGSRIGVEAVSLGETTPLEGLAEDHPLQRRVALWARSCPLG